MARPRKSEERDTRQDILDAALDLFAQDGFFGTSMRQIARKVGVRESALYHHFDSKEAMLHGLLQTLGPGHARHLLEIDLGAMAESLGPKRMLEQLAQAMVAAWTTPHEQKLMRLMLSEGTRLDECGVIHLPTYIRDARGRVARVFEGLVKRKLIRKVDPIGTTMAFMGPLIMLRMMYLVMPKGPPDLKGLQAEIQQHLDHFWSCVRIT